MIMMLILATTPPKQNIIALLHIPAFLASEYHVHSVPHSAIHPACIQLRGNLLNNLNRFYLLPLFDRILITFSHGAWGFLGWGVVGGLYVCTFINLLINSL